jgi:hypothetical protein
VLGVKTSCVHDLVFTEHGIRDSFAFFLVSTQITSQHEKRILKTASETLNNEASARISN